MEQIENVSPKKRNKKKGCLIGGLIFLAITILLITVIPSDGEKTEEQESPKTEENADVVKSVWRSSESVDEMTNEVFYFMETTSLNELEFSFPYEGGSTFYLTIRGKAQKQPEIILSTNRGQFIPSINSEHLRVKFDDEEAFNVTYNSPESCSSEAICIKSEGKILKKLATAKTLKIEAPFFEDGRQIIEFDVTGFSWEH